jgi:hypothetical protein
MDKRDDAAASFRRAKRKKLTIRSACRTLSGKLVGLITRLRASLTVAQFITLTHRGDVCVQMPTMNQHWPRNHLFIIAFNTALQQLICNISQT